MHLNQSKHSNRSIPSNQSFEQKSIEKDLSDTSAKVRCDINLPENIERMCDIENGIVHSNQSIQIKACILIEALNKKALRKII